MLGRSEPPTEGQHEQPLHFHLQYMYAQRLQKNMLDHIPKNGEENKTKGNYKQGNIQKGKHS